LVQNLSKRGSRVINKLFNKTMQKLSAKYPIGGPHGISEKVCAGRSPRSLPWYPPSIICLLRMWAM